MRPLSRSADWRHYAAAALLLGLLANAVWRLLSAPAARPTGAAPAGAQPRFQDAPEGPPVSRGG